MANFAAAAAVVVVAAAAVVVVVAADGQVRNVLVSEMKMKNKN